MENQAPKLPPDSAAKDSAHHKRSALLEQAREMNSHPGIYLMKDASGGVLYVGKAKNLKNRLLTYFQPAVHDSPRIEMLVHRVDRFEVILTETESEALILEATLIKKYKPKFNIRLKDDKAYPYLKLQVNQPFPKIEWTRRVSKDGARYFGPFPSAASARQVMQLLNETFRLRDCSENTFRNRTRPCILYQMGKCSGPCVGLIQNQDYQGAIQEVIAILEGKGDRLIQEIRKKMEEAAEKEEFEQAAQYRDQLRNLELVTQTQGVFEAGSQKHRDVVGLARAENEAHGTLLRIRSGKLVSVQHFYLQNADSSVSNAQLLFDFISQYYLSLKADLEKQPETQEAEGSSGNEGDPSYPQEVLVPEPADEMQLLERTLGIEFLVPEESKNSILTQLIQLARSNAEHALEQARKRQFSHGLNALEEVREKLHLPHPPHRIECYDISNIHGQDAVASRIVFVDGAPDKNLYRRYKIRTVEGSNDFAMMKEVLGRRFSNREENLPDLVVVDGGKGQLSQAVTILDELSVQGVGVVGLAKARVESDFKATEVKSSHERVFIPNRKNPVPLLPHTAAYKLLTHVRDEAHRFAVSYHRLLRSKRSLRSENG